jgi:hypothetical protein
MRSYWLRIGLGAMLIFVVGMGVVRAGRKGVETARDFIDHGRSVNIPFAIIPFKLDGRGIGSIRQIQLDRSGPRQIDGVHLVVRLDDTADLDGLNGCQLTAHGLQDIDENTTFACADAADSAATLVHFGEVVFEPTGASMELVLPAVEVAQWSDRAEAAAPAVANARQAVVNARATMERALLQVRDNHGREVVRLNADSLGAFLRVRDAKGNDVVNLRADSGGLVLHVRDDSGGVVDIHAGNH